MGKKLDRQQGMNLLFQIDRMYNAELGDVTDIIREACLPQEFIPTRIQRHALRDYVIQYDALMEDYRFDIKDIINNFPNKLLNYSASFIRAIQNARATTELKEKTVSALLRVR